MSENVLTVVLRGIRKLLNPTAGDQTTDSALLVRFVSAHDEGAFGALVQRHGPMVWGVCRRVARDAHAAEDAFQATWLVLTRRAGSLRNAGSLPGWLHRVAYRLALAARARPAAPLQDVPGEAPAPEDEAALRELRRVIDEEVNHLPA